ncbi:hypothetical protein FB45DRAFT_1005553 [Roridomyces roridus]|uniref:Uncharacterized protein n=1 Tax=Roridomyces roridus TaxID=1738132 RepID=A0AAD7BMC0_9AGAR|nr:hypothetical protein FB45DRAFT_1005553 [Roridomyces roridus]
MRSELSATRRFNCWPPCSYRVRRETIERGQRRTRCTLASSASCNIKNLSRTPSCECHGRLEMQACRWLRGRTWSYSLQVSMVHWDSWGKAEGRCGGGGREMSVGRKKWSAVTGMTPLTSSAAPAPHTEYSPFSSPSPCKYPTVKRRGRRGISGRVLVD